MPTRVYIAADDARANEAAELARACLARSTLQVISTWHELADKAEANAGSSIGGPPADTGRRAAQRDVSQILESDVVIVITTGEPGRGERLFETGFAVAAGKKVLLFGPAEHAFDRLPEVNMVASQEALWQVLDEQNPSLTVGTRRSTPASRLAAEAFAAQGFAVPPAPTLNVDDTLRGLWPKLIKEEVAELQVALDRRDLVEVADALADLLYLAYSAAASFGIPIDDVFIEVHRSNLTKVVEGKVHQRADGKVLKPETFSAPNLTPILKRAGADL